MVRLSLALPLLLVSTALGFAPQGAPPYTFGPKQQQAQGSVLHLSIGGTDVDPTVIAAVGVALIGGVGSAVLSSKIREMDEQEGGSAAGSTTTSVAASPSAGSPSSSPIDLSARRKCRGISCMRPWPWSGASWRRMIFDDAPRREGAARLLVLWSRTTQAGRRRVELFCRCGAIASD